MDFLTLRPKAFGLDFSDLSLKIIKLKKKGRFLDLSAWGEIKIKKGIIEEGEVKDPQALCSIIKDNLLKIKGGKLKTKNVVASLPEKNAFLQVIHMPKMSKEELNKAVPFEAENYIPLPVNEVYLDFQVIPSARGYLGDHISVLIAAIPKKIVDPYVSCLKSAGLFPLAMEVESQSISRALIKNEFTTRPVLLIDFGKSRASFIIFSGYSLVFTSSIPISSHKLTEAVSKSLKITLAEAEGLKIKYGLKGSLAEKQTKEEKLLQKEVFKAMSPVLDNLISQIEKYLNYYQTHTKDGHLFSSDRKIDKVLLCGRGANLKGLPDFLSSNLKIPVELGNPWINILPASFKKIPQLSFKDSLGYTSALGLALRCSKLCNFEDNL